MQIQFKYEKCPIFGGVREPYQRTGQCIATTKTTTANSRCIISSMDGSEFCHVHRKIYGVCEDN